MKYFLLNRLDNLDVERVAVQITKQFYVSFKYNFPFMEYLNFVQDFNNIDKWICNLKVYNGSTLFSTEKKKKIGMLCYFMTVKNMFEHTLSRK